MQDPAPSPDDAEDDYTLLCVRADGIAPVIDLMSRAGFGQVRSRAAALLREHASCQTVEVWRGGVLLEQVARS